jgi:Rrf2 family iron-sulfur cluster assembly transcriptional regulator
MRLTTKGRFAVTAMLDLAMHEDGKPVTLAGISERQAISLSYLEQLFSRLRRNGLVKSVRGPGGGYRLAKLPNEVSVSQIISAVDELIDATQCGGQENCRDERRCMTHDLWSSLNDKILDYLSGVSLADLVASQSDGKQVIFASRECTTGTSKPRAQSSECPKLQKQFATVDE